MAVTTLPRREGYGWPLLQNKKFLVGVLIIVALVTLAIGGSLSVERRDRRAGRFATRLPPTAEAPLGTDSLGRSIAIQMTEAVPNSMQVGLIAAAIGTILGAFIGFASGYFGKLVDALLRILIDVFLSVPSLLFLILIASLVKGVGVQTMALIIGIFAWAWPARQVRAQVLSLKERAFVQVARLSGMGGLEIIVRELMPHMLPWLGANFVNAFIAAILAEAGLSILGLGPQREMTLGTMIYWALSYGAILQNLWWWWLTPVLTLILLFVALYLVHLGFDEVSNPRLRAQA
ncbi:MAG: ABC transporter permease [Ardenticatenaceae bacterium]|nr:ABC transporter permease [Ardenticatenaceae bacterium]HBY96077.1 maltose ABC transporter permease [Chloroflexota bacterium]